MATQDLKGWWSTLTPDKRRVVMGIGSLVVLLLVVYLFLRASPSHHADRTSNAHSEVNLLTGSDTRTLGLESVGAELRDQQRKQRELQGSIDRLQQESVSKDDLKGLISQLGTISQMVGTLKTDKVSGTEHPTGGSSGVPGTSSGVGTGAAGGLILPPGKDRPSSLLESLQKGQSVSGSSPEAPKIVVYGESEPQAANKLPASAGALEEVYLPAGSLLSGVLLTGVDAPTGLRAKRDPVPALMRVKHEAILPGRFHADVRECFLLFGVTGDLSTERGFMRGETLSCVRHDGGVIETSVDAYGLGDDGKAGIRGRLVSRDGAAVAKAAVASFSEALSQIFRPVAIAGLNTSPTSQTEFQAPNTPQALEASGYAGLGGAAHRLSEHFVALADEMVPIVEIDPARPVQAVLLKGVVLKLRSASK